MLKQRMIYLTVTGVVLVIGYLSRQWSVRGSITHDYAGDAIWAAMIYCGFRFLIPAKPPVKALGFALLASWLIEFSQLYQAEWINSIRHTRLGGLILGFSFLWSDLLMYSLGIFTAWAVDQSVRQARRKN